MLPVVLIFLSNRLNYVKGVERFRFEFEFAQMRLIPHIWFS